MAARAKSSDISQLYGPERRSALYQWHRSLQTRIGNKIALWMARHWRRMPQARSHRLGVAIGAAMRLLSPRHANIVMANLRLAFGQEKSQEELTVIAKACYRHLGVCMTEFIRLPALSNEDLRRLAALRGKEHLDAALSLGRGVILLTAHLGNWEIAGGRIAAEGYPLNVIARSQRDNEITDYIRRTREKTGMRVLHREVAVRQSLRALRQNQIVGILLDQNAGDDGLFVDFFGHLASTAPGAAAFALTTGATVLPVFGRRLADGSHDIRIEPPVPLIETGDRAHDLLANTAQYTKIIEIAIRERPEQWFWLHKRWKARPPQEREVT